MATSNEKSLFDGSKSGAVSQKPKGNTNIPEPKWKGRHLIAHGQLVEKFKKRMNDNKIELVKLAALTSHSDKECKLFLYPVEIEDLSHPALREAMSKCTQTTYKYTRLPPASEDVDDYLDQYIGCLHLFFKLPKDAKSAVNTLSKMKKDINIFHEAHDGIFSELVSSFNRKYLGSDTMRNCPESTLVATKLPDTVSLDDLWETFPLACRIVVKSTDDHRVAYVLFISKKTMDANVEWLNSHQPREDLRKTKFVVYSDVQGDLVKGGQKPKENQSQNKQPSSNQAHGKQDASKKSVQKHNDNHGQNRPPSGYQAGVKPNRGPNSYNQGGPHHKLEGSREDSLWLRPPSMAQPGVLQPSHHNVGDLRQPRGAEADDEHTRRMVDDLLVSLGRLGRDPRGTNALQKLAESLMEQTQPGGNLQMSQIQKLQDIIKDFKEERRGDVEERIQGYLDSNPFHRQPARNLLDFQQRTQPLMASGDVGRPTGLAHHMGHAAMGPDHTSGHMAHHAARPQINTLKRKNPTEDDSRCDVSKKMMESPPTMMKLGELLEKSSAPVQSNYTKADSRTNPAFKAPDDKFSGRRDTILPQETGNIPDNPIKEENQSSIESDSFKQSEKQNDSFSKEISVHHPNKCSASSIAIGPLRPKESEMNCERNEYNLDKNQDNLKIGKNIDSNPSSKPKEKMNSDFLASINILSKIVRANKDQRQAGSWDEGYPDRRRPRPDDLRQYTGLLPTPRPDRGLHDQHQHSNQRDRREDSYGYPRRNNSMMS